MAGEGGGPEWGFGPEVGDGAGLTTPPPAPGEALKEELGHLVLLVLRDGKKVTGWFRSFDQFGAFGAGSWDPQHPVTSHR